MKFLCLTCDAQMVFEERQLPGDGTMAAAFRCPECGREIAMLANPAETRLVSALGVQVGGREVPEQPLELVRSSLAGGREEAFAEEDALPEEAAVPETAKAAAYRETARVTWSVDAVARLGAVPTFVRGMVKRIYTDYAREHGLAEVTPAVMDRARSDLGLEGM